MLEEIKKQKTELETKITTLLQEFENVVGLNSISSISFRRWNGSNAAFGKISSCKVIVEIF